ncbi:S8 family serine peptidase [Rugosimonospora africana]|uniref:Peptidase S8/S53 domain-containing protein n=1 Tax=Rugosimonospora africana TaxID=556532 RepID=A0A8J3QV93_9ACTN|nr:S8 family serine peptidase [Rugosimonospora africana]GIH16445.1 hypothetical protein Raf01_46170 [Rugosimonospora africana]
MRSWPRAGAVMAVSMLLIAMTPSPAPAAPSPRSDEWWLSSWGIDKIWPITQGKGVTVAVLDTGVNADLPELAGHVLPGTDVTGEGGDGRTDIDTQAGGHGTAMAALIVGQGRGTGLVGVAPEATVLPVTVTDGTAASAEPFHEHIAAGIRFAVNHGATVVSISQAYPADGWPQQCPPDILDAIVYASRHDTVIVASTGNDGGVGNSAQAPASCPGVLAVGGVMADVKPWPLTQQVPFVGVAGPAGAVGLLDKHGQLSTGSGTSQAAALVAGGIALARAANPTMPARQIVQRSMATALDSGAPGFDNQTGYGAFRIHRVMDLSFQVPDNAPNPTYERLDKVLNAQAGATAQPTSTGPAASNVPRAESPRKSSTGPVVVAGSVILALLVIGGLVLAGKRRAARPKQWQNVRDIDE